MLTRDFLQKAIDETPDKFKERVQQYVAEADERYRGFTVEDSGERMAKIAQVEVSERGWWSFRVPDSGPITQDLANY